MIEKIFDAHSKHEHAKERRYLTVVLKKGQVRFFTALLNKVVKVYDCDIVQESDCTIMALTMSRDRYLKFLDAVTSSGYALFAFPNTKILYALIEMT